MPVDLMESLYHQVISRQNAVFFALREFVRSGAGEYKELAEDKELELSDELEARYKVLLSKYPRLQHAHDNATAQRFSEILTYSDYLDRLNTDINLPKTEALHWIDVGCKNWAYVDAIDAYCNVKQNIPYQLSGVEVDGYRRYVDGHNRKEYAETYIKQIPNAAFYAQSIMTFTQHADVITCFFPFVFEDPCLHWGLPLSQFQPQIFLNHLLSLLKPGGVLIIINQDHDEYEEQYRLLTKTQHTKNTAKFDISRYGVMPDSFLEYRYKHYATIVHRKGL